MAFETHLVAIRWQAGRYEVVSQTTAGVDNDALRKDGFLHDASEDAGYSDEAAVLAKSAMRKYLASPGSTRHTETLNWLSSLPSETGFILIHIEEWESSLG